MIEFLTLLLGLVAGAHTVELDVRPPATEVELILDGRVIDRVRRPPWRFAVDLGDELSPHELIAVGYGSDGEEVSRTRQWLNLPREAAEARLLLESGGAGPPDSARLTWASLHFSHPESVRVLFDGEPLEVGPTGQIALPTYAKELVHLLSAEVTFPGDEVARAQAVFGGGRSEMVSIGLTGVPVVAPHGSDALTRDGLDSAFVGAGGEPLEIVSVERPGADVVLVADRPSRLAARERIVAVELRLRSGSWRSRDLLPLGPRNRLRFVWPVVTQSRRGASVSLDPDLFAWRTTAAGTGAALHEALARAAPEPIPQRIADAVAVAGVSAASGNRPRAVVLLVDPETPDTSSYAPSAVRAYLARLRVPLVVWTFSDRSRALDQTWGAARSIAEWRDFRSAVAGLRKELDRQAIAWLNGSYLPQSIRLAPGARGIRIAGAE